MRTPNTQRGLGGIGLLFVFGLIALVALIVIKCLPLYLNQMKVARVLHSVGEDPELSTADAMTIREHLQRRWMIEDIDGLKPADVKIKRNDQGRSMSYAYEARAHLFYNISVVVDFSDDLPLRSGTGSGD
jgi:hypothetical protein